mmetsp:Transcript_21749/g.35972  ORF Transcript_21749/g.35972 Transcript_21749/m.35972 type:complete len:184 (+) Transcript_21749:162-713(+)|eukprot:CAMPEP_0184654426 /NCGR_PEP_ID=MMETSP0308-20130426/12105_1 /TAXON_ID=38269 /ORGANISM="Gloeochaete witrockiana, Strain SAG 46.84" /LENGTH=183 /DNA_ID=CAMNT_0027090403 /DNA_START=147 /DNA_END=698 /DNA_ORIENTATION=-
MPTCIVGKSDCQFQAAYDAFQAAAIQCPAFKVPPADSPRTAGIKKVHHAAAQQRPDKQCPYTASHDAYVAAIRQCPSCGKGCPFAELTGLDDFFHLLHHSTATGQDALNKLASTCPSFKDGPVDGCTFLAAFKQFKDKIMRCPAFTTGCPFKLLAYSDTRAIIDTSHKVHLKVAVKLPPQAIV